MVETDSHRWWLVPRRIWPPERADYVEMVLAEEGCSFREHEPADIDLLRAKYPDIDPDAALPFYRWMLLPPGWYWAIDADDAYIEEVLLHGGADDREEALVIRCHRGFDRIGVIGGWQGDEPPRMSLLNVGMGFAQNALDGGRIRWTELNEHELDQALDELTKAIDYSAYADAAEEASDAAIREHAAILAAQVRRELRRRFDA